MKARTAARTIVGMWLPLALMGQAPREGEVRLAEGAPNGEIRGTVVDASAQPVAGAKVTADPVGSFHHMIRWVTADQEGRFDIDGLGWGDYRFRAKKEADGYPDTSFSIFVGSYQSVTLSPGASKSTVVVALGPKAAFITSSFTDAETGQELTAGVRIWTWDDPRVYFTTGFMPGFRPSPDLLIPAGKPIGIEFSAAGYDPWRHPSGTLPGQPITLGPAERQTIQVRFQRSAAMRKLDARLLRPDISEAEVLNTVTEMFAAAPGDPRTTQEIVRVVKERGTSTLPIAILGKFIPEALVSECLDSADPSVRRAALAALYRRGVMVSHLSAKLRGTVSNPNEEPEAQQQARQLLRASH